MRLHRTTRRRRRLHAQLHPSTQHTFEAFVHHHRQHLRLCLPLAVIAAYNIYIYDSYARQHTHHTHISYMHAGGIADYNSTPSRFVYVVNCVWTMQYRRFVKIHWQSASERNTIDLCPPYIKHTQYTHIAHTHTTKTTTTRATTSAVLPVACIRVLRTLRTSRAVCQPVTLHGPSVSSVSSVGRHIFFFVCCFVVIPHTHTQPHTETVKSEKSIRLSRNSRDRC